MNSKILITAAALALFSLPALALDLQQARQQGLVGEQTTGYVAPLDNNPDVQRLATEVNAKRRQEYQRISQENGQPVDVVAKLAAQQIMQQLPSGAMYQDASGGWKKR